MSASHTNERCMRDWHLPADHNKKQSFVTQDHPGFNENFLEFELHQKRTKGGCMGFPLGHYAWLSEGKVISSWARVLIVRPAPRKKDTFTVMSHCSTEVLMQKVTMTPPEQRAINCLIGLTGFIRRSQD